MESPLKGRPKSFVQIFIIKWLRTATRRQGNRATASDATNERWEEAPRWRLGWNFCGTCSGYLWTLSNLLNPRQQNNLWPPKSANNATSQRGWRGGAGEWGEGALGWWRHLLLAKGRTGSNRPLSGRVSFCGIAARKWFMTKPRAGRLPQQRHHRGMWGNPTQGGGGQVDRCPDRVAFVA